MMDRRLESLWENLQSKKLHMPHFLTEVLLEGIRGIDNLRVVFDYPVSVIAGGNASGKTTVLFAAACAYKVPGAGIKDFVPSTLFPDYRPRVGAREDERPEVILQFDYSTPKGRESMRWRRAKGWNRSFLGRKGASQPERQVYLRTLSNLSNPSEVRGVLSLSRSRFTPNETRLTASQIEFAQSMLPFRYREVVDLSSGAKSLLFAAQEGGSAYSELHMAAGERAILRLSQEIAQLDNALILVDEVEAGLHPWAQRLLMLQLQQLSLRNNLQIIVTSHSPVVLDSVPSNGRIFLDRDQHGKVSVLPAYRDIIQNALYGRSDDALNLLCEDDTAEGILRGVFDFLAPRQNIMPDSLRIGRDTGADEFPSHANAFRKFGQIDNFIFVLDGDRRRDDISSKIRDASKADVPIFFLPGNDAPEIWIWERMSEGAERYFAELGLSSEHLMAMIEQTNAVFDFASDSPSNIAKSKLNDLSDKINRSSVEICRIVARLESGCKDSDIRPLVEALENALINWRSN